MKRERFHDFKVNLVNKIVQRSLSREFDFDLMNVMILPPPGGILKGLRMSENPRYIGHPLICEPYSLQAQSASVRFDPIPILFGRVHILTMNIDNPKVQVVRDRQGNFSFIDLMLGSGSLMNWLKIRKLTYNNGEVHFVDERAPREPANFMMDSVQLEINDFAADQSCSINLSSRMPAASKPNLNIAGKIGPLSKKFDLSNTFVDIDFHLAQSPVEPYLVYVTHNLPLFPKTGMVQMKLQIKGDIEIGFTIQGVIHFNELIMQSQGGEMTTNPLTIAMRFGDNVCHHPLDDLIIIHEMQISVNHNRFGIQGKVEQIRNKPRWDLKLKSKGFDIQEMMAAFPFVKEMIPEEILSVSGLTAVDIRSSGRIDESNIRGYMDLTESSFRFANIAYKSRFRPFNVSFIGILYPERWLLSIKGEGEIQTKKGTMKVHYHGNTSLAPFQEFLAIREMTIGLNGNAFKVNGKVEKLKTKPGWDLRIDSVRFDIGLISAFPFINQFLPKDVTLSGFAAIHQRFSGNLEENHLSGGVDLTEARLNVFGFITKPESSLCKMSFDAKSIPGTEKAAISCEFECQNSEIASTHLMGIIIKGLSNQLGTKINLPHYRHSARNPAVIDMTCRLESTDNLVTIRSLHIKNIRHGLFADTNVDMTGRIFLDARTLALLGTIRFPASQARELVKRTGSLKKYVLENDTLALPFSLTESFER